MDKILSFNTIKNVFAALGAKTSDDNYGVALLDKTTAEPKGLMGMSDLASVLGVGGNVMISRGTMDILSDENPIKNTDYLEWVSFGRNNSANKIYIGWQGTTPMSVGLFVKSNKDTSWHTIPLT